MSGVAFSETTEKRKGILLDPRTKLLLLLMITTLMFSTSNEGIMNIIKPCLSLVPFVLILSEHRFKTAGKYLLLYVACFALERIALVYLSGLLSFIVLAVTSIMTRFAPGIMTGAWLISSTSVSEFIGGNGAYAHHRKNCHPHVCDFSFFPNNRRRISGNPGCHENAGYPIRWEKSFAAGGIQAGSFDGIRCKDW